MSAAPHYCHHMSSRCPMAPRRRPRAFTLVEMMVVIGLIVLLATILLVALGQVLQVAKKTTTVATMDAFGNACQAFQQEHGSLPGVIPDQALADGEDLSSTQNALLHLMGGYRAMTDLDAGTAVETEYQAFRDAANSAFEYTFTDGPRTWSLVVDRTRIGEGPLINGKPYQPYLSLDDRTLFVGTGTEEQGINAMPNIVDGWGQPIVYLRRGRTNGPVVRDIGDADELAQYEPSGIDLYLTATNLGRLGMSQQQGTEFTGSRLDDGDLEERRMWLTLMLANPAFYDTDNPWYGTTRGSYVLFSAGKDGIFLARNDGPVDDDGVPDVTFEGKTPNALEEFDDVVVHGG